MYPRITVVTVNYNLAEFLEETMLSVLNQNYPNLEYIVIDGGSTDGSVDIIRKYQDRLAFWVSEPDKGQYHALQKGFERATGEIMCWLNSDDLFHHNSLFAVAEIFNSFPEVDWLMGFPTEFARNGSTVHRITLPWARWSQKRYLSYDFQFIQQESCFWRKSLWDKAGSKLDGELKLAGDMELWARFFRHARLYTTLTLLGGFRYRGGDQRSRTQMQAYLDECQGVIRRERSRLGAGKKIGLTLQRWLAFPFGMLFFLDIPIFRFVYESLYQIPPVIRYDFDREKYLFSKRQVKHPPLYLGGKQVARK